MCRALDDTTVILQILLSSKVLKNLRTRLYCHVTRVLDMTQLEMGPIEVLDTDTVHRIDTSF